MLNYLCIFNGNVAVLISQIESFLHCTGVSNLELSKSSVDLGGRNYLETSSRHACMGKGQSDNRWIVQQPKSIQHNGVEERTFT